MAHIAGSAAAEHAYLGSPRREIAATLALLRHFRAFLRSPYQAMNDTTRGRPGVHLDKENAQRRLSWLVEVAIFRKGGGDECLGPAEIRRGQQADEVRREARRYAKDDPEIPSHWRHFSPAMLRAMRKLLERGGPDTRARACVFRAETRRIARQAAGARLQVRP